MGPLAHDWEREVASYLTDHPKVVIAFLFGSFAKSRPRRDSDVDLAVHLAVPYSQEDISSIWSRLEDITHRDVDLIVLNTAPPGIAWAAMKGTLLVDKNPRLRIELMLEKSREAEDFREFVASLLEERRSRRRDEGVRPVS